VVTTPEGAFGLEHRDGDDLLVRRGVEPFANGILELLGAPERRDALRRAGLLRAAAYDWRRISGDLVAASGHLAHDPEQGGGL
jgi:glycosyltransferase involved in cell wall biosynthesis